MDIKVKFIKLKLLTGISSIRFFMDIKVKRIKKEVIGSISSIEYFMDIKGVNYS